MANVLVNDRCLYHGRTGVTTYLRYLLSSWPEGGPTMRGLCTHTLLRRRSWPVGSGPAETALALQPLSKLARRPNRVPSVFRRMTHGGYDLSLRAGAAMSGARLYFEPNHLAVGCSLPTVTTVHDLSVLMHPSWHPADRVARWRSSLARAVAQTTRWIAVSEWTRDCVVRLLKVDPSLVTVIPLAPRFGPAGDGRPSLLPQPYFLHVGTLEPRKNITVLLDAYAAVPRAVRKEFDLVLLGELTCGNPAFHRALVEHPISPEARVAGYVSDDLLERLLRGATALLAPSHLEGFGLPVLEAMAVGTPVICSKAEAFVEVAGGAAEHVDAGDVGGWANRMLQAAEDSSWRTSRAQAGLARARGFSWEKTAGAHAALMQAMVS